VKLGKLKNYLGINELRLEGLWIDVLNYFNQKSSKLFEAAQQL
jgi:hypothetical protein